MSNPAIIFLHGGPGYNCSTFEVTTAQKLADAGFFVIVYDRRGEGRSNPMKAKFNFKESYKDLKSLYSIYEIESASLIGHSFGGIVATKFAKSNLKMMDALVLVGAPVSLQESFLTIIASSKKIYTEQNDKSNLNYLNMLADMDPKSLEYATYCFAHAMQNGFYSTATPMDEANALFESFKADSTLQKFAADMTPQPTQGFWKNEDYTSLDLSSDLAKLKAKGLPVYGLYGKEDGLYSPEQIEDLKSNIGSENVKYLDNCSHSVFIDQQSVFITWMKTWVGQK
jgi:proline iminopeptidase